MRRGLTQEAKNRVLVAISLGIPSENIMEGEMIAYPDYVRLREQLAQKGNVGDATAIFHADALATLQAEVKVKYSKEILPTDTVAIYKNIEFYTLVTAGTLVQKLKSKLEEDGGTVADLKEAMEILVSMKAHFLSDSSEANLMVAFSALPKTGTSSDLV